jgi:nucleoid DNA-binding protein
MADSVITRTDLRNNLYDYLKESGRFPKLTKSDASTILTAIFGDRENAGIIPDAVKRGLAVKISNFGNFEKKRTKARMGRNPQTGEQIKIPAKTKLAFRFSKSVKDYAL